VKKTPYRETRARSKGSAYKFKLATICFDHSASFHDAKTTMAHWRHLVMIFESYLINVNFTLIKNKFVISQWRRPHYRS
jgi:hypothetical protein